MLPYGMQAPAAHGHALYGSSLSSLPEPSTNPSDPYRYSHWQSQSSTTSPIASAEPEPFHLSVLQPAYSQPSQSYAPAPQPASASGQQPTTSTQYDPRDRYGFYQQQSYRSGQQTSQRTSSSTFQYYDHHAPATPHQHGSSSSSQAQHDNLSSSYESNSQHKQPASPQYESSQPSLPESSPPSLRHPSVGQTPLPSVQRLTARGYLPSTQPSRPSSLRQVSNFDHDSFDLSLRSGGFGTNAPARAPESSSYPSASRSSASGEYSSHSGMSSSSSRYTTNDPYYTSSSTFDHVPATAPLQPAYERSPAASAYERDARPYQRAESYPYSSMIPDPLEPPYPAASAPVQTQSQAYHDRSSPDTSGPVAPSHNTYRSMSANLPAPLEPPPAPAAAAEGAMADYTGSTLTDQEWFGTPAESRTPMKVEEDEAKPPTEQDETATRHASALTAALEKMLDAAAPQDSLSLSPTRIPSVEAAVPTVEVTHALALPAIIIETEPAPRLPAPMPPKPRATPSKRGGRGRKRGSAVSTPARSRLATPHLVPPVQLVAKIRPRCRFDLAPIAFHIGPTDEVDPRTTGRGRGKQFTLLAPLSDRERDRDLFRIRGKTADGPGLGSRTRPTKGSTASSRAASVAASSDPAAPPEPRITRAAARGGTAAAKVINYAQPVAAPPKKSGKGQAPLQPLFTTVPLPLPRPGPPASSAQGNVANGKRKRETGESERDDTYNAVKRAKQAEQHGARLVPAAAPASPAAQSVQRASSLTPLTEPPLSPLSEAASEPEMITAGSLTTVDDVVMVEEHQVKVESPYPQSITLPPEEAPRPVQRQSVPVDRTPSHQQPYSPREPSSGPVRQPIQVQTPSTNHEHRTYSGMDAAEHPISPVAGPSRSPRVSLSRPSQPPPPAPPYNPAAASAAAYYAHAAAYYGQHSTPPNMYYAMPYYNGPPPGYYPVGYPPYPVAPQPPPQPPAATPQRSTSIPAAPTQSPTQAHVHASAGSVSRGSTPTGDSPTEEPETATTLIRRAPRRMAIIPSFSQDLPPPTVTLFAPRVEAVMAIPRHALQHGAPQLTRAELMNANPDDFPILTPPPGSFSMTAVRSYPADVEVRADRYPLWYRRFPLVSTFKVNDPMGDAVFQTPFRARLPPGASFNNPTLVYDLYTPRLTRGSGREKQGLCPICAEPIERGGEGKEHWFAMKISAYNYHMCNSHGISATTKLPFSPPMAFRRVTRRGSSNKHEKLAVLEGKCHECTKFVPLEGVKVGEIKVKEIYWWKHAAKCHQSLMEGETDVYYEDEIVRRVKGYERMKKLMPDPVTGPPPVPPAYIRVTTQGGYSNPLAYAPYPTDHAAGPAVAPSSHASGSGASNTSPHRHGVHPTH